MKIKKLKLNFIFLMVLALFASCDEDDGPTVEFNPEDRGEQQIIDDSTLVDFLSTHYYNSSFFDTGSNHKIEDIEITELMEGESVPNGHALLIDAMRLETVEVEYLEVQYKYYVLRLNEGGGDAPHFTDIVRVRYEGTNVVEGDIFDSVSTPAALNLQGDGVSPGAIKGWQYILPTFNTAESFTNGGDGITNYDNYGLGVMFIPSGLAYFFGTQTGVAYSNLIFKFELLQYQVRDHDLDGIPSYVENIDSFGTSDNDFDVLDDDTDEDLAANFIDLDDDGDGVATFNELMQTTYTVDTNMGEEEPVLAVNEYEIDRSTVNGIITIRTVTALDDDGNGILDYLDENVTINYNEES